MSRHSGTLKLVTLLTVVTALSGCGFGKDSILFTTKTSLGLDFDTKPMTVDIGYARKEGTIAPVNEKGKVLPQMASFSANVGVMNQAVGQSIATGNAAVLISKYLTSPARPGLDPIVPDKDIYDIPTIEYTGRERRYFFGTDTAVALRIGFAPEQGAVVPDSLSFGYKRKEVAFVPILFRKLKTQKVNVVQYDDNNAMVMKDGKPLTREMTVRETDGQERLALPALIATVGVDGDKGGVGSRTLKFKQFYATGKAANNLAALPEIRAEIAPMMMANAKEAVQGVKDQLAVRDEIKRENAGRISKEEAETAAFQKQAWRQNSLIDEIRALKDEQAIDAETKLPDPTDVVLAKEQAMTTPGVSGTTGVAAVPAPTVDLMRKVEGNAARKSLETRAIYYESQNDFDRVESMVKAVKAK